jgi:hypothetical protein
MSSVLVVAWSPPDNAGSPSKVPGAVATVVLLMGFISMLVVWLTSRKYSRMPGSQDIEQG